MEIDKATEVLARELARLGYINLYITSMDKERLFKYSSNELLRVEDEDGRPETFTGYLSGSLNEEYYVRVSKNSNLSVDKEIIKAANDVGANYLIFERWESNSYLVEPYRMIGQKEKEILSKLLAQTELTDDISIALKQYGIDSKPTWLELHKELIDIYKNMDSEGYINEDTANKLGLMNTCSKKPKLPGVVSTYNLCVLEGKKHNLDLDIYSLVDNFSDSYISWGGLGVSLLKFHRFYKDKSLKESLDIDKALFKKLVNKKIFVKERDKRDWKNWYSVTEGEEGFKYLKTKVDIYTSDAVNLLSFLPVQDMDANKHLLNEVICGNDYSFLFENYIRDDTFQLDVYLSCLTPKNLDEVEKIFKEYSVENTVPEKKKDAILNMINDEKKDFLYFYKQGPKEFDNYFKTLDDEKQEEIMKKIMKLPENRRNPETGILISEKYSNLIGDTFRKGVEK